MSSVTPDSSRSSLHSASAASQYPWAQTVMGAIRERVDNDSLPNAIVLTSPPGWGLAYIAECVVAALLELDPAAQDSIRRVAHPDFRWVEAETAEIKIDQIRALNEFAVQTAQIAPRKVGVICDAERLNENAANALLKTLEEPPPNTHLILLTQQWGRLLPTIRSRSQRFRVETQNEMALQWLAQVGIQTSELEFQLAGAAPIPLVAQRGSQQAGGKEAGALEESGGLDIDISEWLSSAAKATALESIKAVNAVDPVVLLTFWYRRIKLHLSGQFALNIGAADKDLHLFADQLLSVRRQIESKNSARASATLMLEGLLVEWRRLCNAVVA